MLALRSLLLRHPRTALPLFAALVALELARALVLTTDFLTCGDCPRYVDIAESPFVFTASPWGFRGYRRRTQSRPRISLWKGASDSRLSSAV